jgi:hypothetical protein
VSRIKSRLQFERFIRALPGVAGSGCAAAIASAMLRGLLIPQQLYWLYQAGIIVSSCIAVASYGARQVTIRNKRIVIRVLLCAVVALVFMRSLLMTDVTILGREHRYLVGFRLTAKGERASENCRASTVRDLVMCSGPDSVPMLFGWSYELTLISYVGIYLAVVASFTGLISAIVLEEQGRRPSQHRRRGSGEAS